MMSMNPFEPQGPNSPGRQPANYFAQQGTGNPFDDPAMFERNRPPAPPRPPSRFKRFAVSAALSVATAACCGGINAVFNDDDEKKRNTAVASTPTPSPTYSRPSPTYSPPPTSRSAAPPPSPTANPLDAVGKGDCLKNTGTDSDPEMVPVACGAGTYQVLKRVYGTIDASQCQSVSGATTTYTVTYYRNGITQISQSYVFCLKKR
jgi:hypothetical protein